MKRIKAENFLRSAKAPGDEGRSDDGEHHLEQHEYLMWDRLRVRVEGVPADPAQPNPLEAADDPPLVGAEGEL